LRKFPNCKRTNDFRYFWLIFYVLGLLIVRQATDCRRVFTHGCVGGKGEEFFAPTLRSFIELRESLTKFNEITGFMVFLFRR
jgi:hypothetical protein